MAAVGFQNGQVAALASEVDRSDDGYAIFHGKSGLILDLFGLDRVEFKASGSLLMVKVYAERRSGVPRHQP